MASIGKADLIIVPKFNGLTAQVNKALDSASRDSGVSGAGKRAGSAFAAGFGSAGGVAKAGALMGAFSAVTSKAMDVVAAHVGDAVSRLDTLKNYPQVMQSLGVGAQEAQSSIQMMSDRLSVLPTRLDTMAQTVQGLYAATKDTGTSLTTATKAGLALNDMLLAGGQSTTVVNAAAEQFRQVLAKGKPDMQDWRSLLSAAPGQMDQLAKSMLGATATTDQLYYALGGGNEKLAKAAGFDYATISVGQLLDALIRLDSQGGANFDSFAKQAEKAQGGIQTAMANMSNAVTKGMANVMDSFGRENIVSQIDNVKSSINEMFDGIAGFASQHAPEISGIVSDAIGAVTDGAKTVGSVLSDVGSAALPVISDIAGKAHSLAPEITTAATAFMGFRAAGTVVSGVGKAMSGLQKATKTVSEVLLGIASNPAMGDLGKPFLNAASGFEVFSGMMTGPVGLGVVTAITAIGGTLGYFAAQEIQARKEQEDFNTALSSFNDAVSRATSLDDYAEKLSRAGDVIPHTTEHLDNLTKTLSDNAQQMQNNNAQAEETIGTWQRVQSIIDNVVGKSKLTVEQQGQLKWALQQLNTATGETISQEDALAGSFTNTAGEVQNLKNWVDQLAQAKIQEARTNALQADLTTAYSSQRESAASLSEAYQDYNDKLNDTTKYLMEHEGWTEKVAKGYAMTQPEVVKASQALENAKKAYSDTTDQVKHLEGEMTGLADAANEQNDAFSNIAANPLVSGAFGEHVSDFTDAMRDAGVNLDDFNKKLSDNAELPAQIARSFDDTRASIVRALDDAGVAMDDNGKKIVQTSRDINDSINNLGVGYSLEKMGTDAQTLADKLTDAGVSAENFGRITPNLFIGLADSVAAAGGDIDTLTSQLQTVSSINIGDKHFVVAGDGLVECNGLILDLNNNTIGDKHFTVSDDGTIQLETGEVINLDQQTINGKHFEITDDGSGNRAAYTVEMVNGKTIRNKVFTINAIDHASGTISSIQRAISAINSKTVTITTVYRTIGNSAGAHRMPGSGSQIPMATGGIIIPRTFQHADGFVARQPTVLHDYGNARDLVGENGAEAVIPLTNRYYSQPFADIIAEGITRRLGDNKGGGTTYNVYIDGAQVNSDAAIEGAFYSLMGELARIKDMGPQKAGVM